MREESEVLELLAIMEMEYKKRDQSITRLVGDKNYEVCKDRLDAGIRVIEWVLGGSIDDIDYKHTHDKK